MTEGHPLKLIMMFALPLLLGNIFQQTYNIVDTAIVGQTLGANALAAVGSTTSVQFFSIGILYWYMLWIWYTYCPVIWWK